ncbi:lipoprotein, putative [Roseobacter sp. SK209-2-6]|uniref:FAD-dependent oxidoreductase n=1 Tax=Roseobacter sp. SK209-2-6 TaxID=388739 RepID=UPI0000F3E433|nr:FAD-dependent oxidoreductase [Roseobacter sp. SK209-2-6]EBA14450.1 lipoprotein, putative [Roseobacter sp. SK209-2-6]
MKTRIHAIAGGIGLLMILTFWTSTILSELFGSHDTIAMVKELILYGMFILVPAMAIVGASGASLGAGRSAQLVSAKKKRMPIIAANGLLILLPMAFVLESKASAGTFDARFYVLQVVELIAGATNITLMAMNARDGVRLTGRSKPPAQVKLLGREIVAKDTIAVRIAKPTGFTYEPGQALRLTIPSGRDKQVGGTSRVLSIASAPHEENLTIVTRLRDSAFKQTMNTMPEGADLQLSGPLGSFVLHDDPTRPAVFLAGGIGITPFLSMIRHATHTSLPHEMTLFYSNRTREDAAMLDELQDIAVSNPNFNLIAAMTGIQEGGTWSGETGRIDAAMLTRHLTGLKGSIYYLVGPRSFVSAMREELVAAGIEKNDMRFEQFTGY